MYEVAVILQSMQAANHTHDQLTLSKMQRGARFAAPAWVSAEPAKLETIWYYAKFICGISISKVNASRLFSTTDDKIWKNVGQERVCQPRKHLLDHFFNSDIALANAPDYGGSTDPLRGYPSQEIRMIHPGLNQVGSSSPDQLHESY